MRGNKILDINYDELKEIIKELSPIGLEAFANGLIVVRITYIR